ncbi:MAG: SPOR domain-containing protein [Alphaproteobacteria bacterium]
MAAANDFDGYGGSQARDEQPGTLSRFMRSQPGYSSFDEEARIRRRDPGYLEQDRLQSLVLVGGFATSALLLFIAGFVSAFLLFDDAVTGDVAALDAQKPEAPAIAAAPAEPSDEPVDFPAQRDFVGTAQADADSDTPPEPTPEVAAARALADSGEPVDAPGNPVVPMDQAEQAAQTASIPPPDPVAAEEPNQPVQLVRTSPEPAGGSESTSATAQPTRGFVLQFGAFGDRKNADNLVSLLNGKVGPVWVIEGKASSGADLFFVRGGAFETRDGAAAAARKLWQSDRIDSFVRTVDRG